MRLPHVRTLFPSWKSSLLAVFAAILLVLAFPDFEYWFLAWIALVPLMWAIERERTSIFSAFILGWLFGVCFFFGTCWWLAYAPIHYAAFPSLLAYFLVFLACSGAAIFPGVSSAILALLLRRFGRWAILAAPFIWVFGEFARYWLTGNNWNAIGYSQFSNSSVLGYATIGGLYAVSFAVVYYNLVARSLIFIIVGLGISLLNWLRGIRKAKKRDTIEPKPQNEPRMFALIDDNPNEVRDTLLLAGLIVFYCVLALSLPSHSFQASVSGRVIAIQPNVPMTGLTHESWLQLRGRHVELTERALATLRERQTGNNEPVTVIFPESPMNFAYEEDEEFRRFVSAFAAKYNANVLFNSAEPDRENRKYFNSAVLVDTRGREIAQYDKIYLLPFGEAVPVPLDSIVPAFVGSFSYGKNYSVIPLGDAKAGIMICFESHFGVLSREYVRRGADVIIELTNDGYLGPTPVLRQHLANAVFRAVETNRPVLRVTNVGISAYVNERGEVLDPAESYTEDVRIWSVARSSGDQTFYVKYGDWFAWLCTVVTFGSAIAGLMRRPAPAGLRRHGDRVAEAGIQ